MIKEIYFLNYASRKVFQWPKPDTGNFWAKELQEYLEVLKFSGHSPLSLLFLVYKLFPSERDLKIPLQDFNNIIFSFFITFSVVQLGEKWGAYYISSGNR